MFGFGKKRKKKEVVIRKNLALSKDDKKYLNFLFEKKAKALKRENKRLTLKHKKEIMAKVKSEKFKYETVQHTTYQNSGMGFFEYYILFSMFQRPYHDHYYSQTFVDSAGYRETDAFRNDNPDYSPSEDRYSSDYAPSSADDYSSSSSSDWGSSSSSDSSSDYGSSSSSDFSSSSSSDFGSSSSSDFGSSSSGGSDF